MVEVRWTNRALDDILNIAEFIAKDSERYAKMQVDRFFKRVEILEEFPNTGKIVPELNKKSIRELIEGNYRIIYKVVSKKHIDILTVHHSARLLNIK
jgi:toxin ParE1/3/4